MNNLLMNQDIIMQIAQNLLILSFAITSYLANKAVDDETAEKLWDLSCEFVKLEDKYKIDKSNVPK